MEINILKDNWIIREGLNPKEELLLWITGCCAGLLFYNPTFEAFIHDALEYPHPCNFRGRLSRGTVDALKDEVYGFTHLTYKEVMKCLENVIEKASKQEEI